MATAKDIKVKGYCDDLGNALTSMKIKIDDLRKDLVEAYGADSEITKMHARHLCELAESIEWKLRILMKACPYDWAGTDKDVEKTVSVGAAGADFSGGYLGG